MLVGSLLLRDAGYGPQSFLLGSEYSLHAYEPIYAFVS